MRRLIFLALLALAVFAVPAVAQTPDTPDATASCIDDDAQSSAASTTDDGGVPAGIGDTDGTGSGGVPASWDGAESSTDAVDAAVGSGDAMAGGGTTADAPAVVVAQEPEPEPEGPGEEQPGEPGGEPQQPTVPPETPGGEAPGVDTGGGGLPRTGLEALRIGLLGVVLLLVGARLRVLALRRRRQASPEWSPDEVEPEVAASYAWAGEERDEWGFPDPDEPAPTGLLPSTATARRQARMHPAPSAAEPVPLD
jgi:hypothetical protein